MKLSHAIARCKSGINYPSFSGKCALHFLTFSGCMGSLDLMCPSYVYTYTKSSLEMMAHVFLSTRRVIFFFCLFFFHFFFRLPLSSLLHLLLLITIILFSLLFISIFRFFSNSLSLYVSRISYYTTLLLPPIIPFKSRPTILCYSVREPIHIQAMLFI